MTLTLCPSPSPQPLRSSVFEPRRSSEASSSRPEVAGHFPRRIRPTARRSRDVAACEAEEVDLAVRSARKSFESGAWSKMRPVDRKKTLLAFADRLEAHAGEIALLDSLEAGKPISDCVNGDIPDTIHCIRWHAELIDKLYDRVAPAGRELGLDHPGTRGCRGGSDSLELSRADGRMEDRTSPGSGK